MDSLDFFLDKSFDRLVARQSEPINFGSDWANICNLLNMFRGKIPVPKNMIFIYI